MFIDLETNRLLLKNISYDDAQFFYKEFSNDDVNRYLYDVEPCTSVNEVDWFLFRIRTKKTT